MKGSEKSLDPQPWQACADEMVQMHQVNSKVFNFPQGHTEHAQAHIDFSASVRIPALIFCHIAGIKYMANRRGLCQN
ncbi:hypothetical protein M0R45_015640 [Rubus argutus]|uniref:Uncharacterized protein n=1 Tax=Rubus argutus TaxID=59490 RepID=A0AAW1XR81_RUBAR